MCVLEALVHLLDHSDNSAKLVPIDGPQRILDASHLFITTTAWLPPVMLGCEMLPTGSCVWILDYPLVMLFREVTDRRRCLAGGREGRPWRLWSVLLPDRHVPPPLLQTPEVAESATAPIMMDGSPDTRSQNKPLLPLGCFYQGFCHGGEKSNPCVMTGELY